MVRLVCALLLISLGAPVRQRPAARVELWAFTGPWDPHSDESLRANAVRLDAVITGWIALDSVRAQPILPSVFPDTIRLADGVRRMAIVTSWHNDRFHASSIRSLARDDSRLAHAAGVIAQHAAAMRYSGLVIDFEELKQSDLSALVRVVKAIADSARRRGISPIAVAIPAADTLAYPARSLVGVADFVLPMLYDQHWSTSGPGPISEPEWVRSTLAMRIAEVGASRIVAGLPTYGYRWRAKSKSPAEDLSYADAKRIVAAAGLSLKRDGRSRTLRARRPGEWEIWVTDAELLSTLARLTQEAGVQRTALWRIGQEDPAIWRALPR